MYKPGFIALAVKGPCTNPATRRHAYHNVRLLAPAVMDLGQVINDLVKTYCNKIRKLHFHHALESFETQSECRTHNGTFTQWRIPHPTLAKFLYKSFRDLEGPAIFSNVLTHQHKIFMLLH